MACTKRELRTLPLLVSAFLLLCTANAIRSFTTEKDHILKDSDILTLKAAGQRFATGGPKTEKRAVRSPDMNDFEENCNNVDDEEECLMRRTLSAHVDYIYTQQHSPECSRNTQLYCLIRPVSLTSTWSPSNL